MKAILFQVNKRMPWLIDVRFSYHHYLKEYIKQFPGAAWDPTAKQWAIPVEFVCGVADKAKEYGFHFTKKVPERCLKEPVRHLLSPKLYNYQQDAVVNSCSLVEHDAWLFNDEMGLGKTPEILSCLQIKKAANVIIVCPAMARQVWVDELDKWWPDHPEVGVATTGEKAASLTTNIRIVSYGLLNKLEIHKKVDAIVFDEIHYLQNESSQRSQAAAKLVRRHPNAWRAGATATLITNEPTTAHNVLNTLWPKRFGQFYKFAMRYTNASRNDYGWEFKGLNQDNKEELKDRLYQLSSRTTKREVAHLLPPFLLQTKFCTETERPKTCATLAQDVLASGAPCVAVITYTRENCAAMAERVAKAGMTPVIITGAATPERRRKLLDVAKDTPGTVICATMSSIQESIDLTFCSYVIVGELYTRPATMIQLLGRFHRLSGNEPVTVVVLGEPGYDRKTQKLAQRLQDIALVMSAGSTDKQLQNELSKLKTEMSDTDFKDLVAEVAKGWE